MSTTQGVGRPSESRTRIENDFRERIVAGELFPGSRFPTRVEIEQHYGASSVTVQKALATLKEDGFIRVDGRKGGTFVVDNPPHLSRYAVVFPYDATSVCHNNFWKALACELEVVSKRRPDCQLPAYYGVDKHENGADFLRLCRDVQSHRVAGLIFTMHPYELPGTPILEEPNIPRVAIMSPFNAPFPVVLPDSESFLVKALDYLKSVGRTEVAFIKQKSNDFSQQNLERLVAQRGMKTHPYWCLDLDSTSVEGLRNSVHLLMRCVDRPTALVICDDNLIEHSTEGLVHAGINVPCDIEVVAHCNFPHAVSCAVPVTRLGFDIHQLLEMCVSSIDRQRVGQTPAAVTKMEAAFAHEIASSFQAIDRPEFTMNNS